MPNSSLKHVNFAIIGFGAFGQKRADIIFRLGSASLLGVYDKNPDLKLPRNVRAYKSAQAILRDPEVDAVIIATPNNSHWEYIKKCHDAGKPALCEKPFIAFPKEAGLSREASPNFVMGSNLAFFPALKAARLFIHKHMNSIDAIEMTIGVDQSKRPCPWRSNTELSGGGVLMDNGVHLVSLAKDIFPDFTVNKSSFVFQEKVDVEVNVSAKGMEIPVSLKASWLEDHFGYTSVKVSCGQEQFLFLANQDRCIKQDAEGKTLKDKKFSLTLNSLEAELVRFLRLIPRWPESARIHKAKAQSVMDAVFDIYKM